MNFVLVGPLFLVKCNLHQQRQHLLGLPNVFHVDTQHPDELRHIIRGARVGLVTYAFEPKQKTGKSPTGSMKILSYLAQGLPVVSSINSYTPGLEEYSVFKAEDEEEFIRVISDIASGKLPVSTSAVSKYLDQITYDRLSKHILHVLRGGHRAWP
jgi:hypothetical protein